MLAITLLSPLRLHGRTYEITINGHIALGACLLGPLWYRLYAVPCTLGPLYLGLAAGLRAIGYLSRFSHIWYWSCGTGPQPRRLRVRPLVDEIQVSIVVPRPWHFRARQHVYLRVIGMGIRAFRQSHPFTIAWWERDRISMLIRPRGGFTSRLLLYAGCTLHALVEGPFGIEHDLGSYGTVLMFASGVGIATQVAYIRRLLEGRTMSKARTQRIVIYWRLDNEVEAQRSLYIPGGRSNSPEHTRNG
ncbi:hypothetical protein C7212DRAFT_181623 [Tuber magnatum]|uniref:ferric-chelate reductase (NADPH) n=1 Tax=Tuber magnatum TaxID=42249 RepID=A0A317SS72_9PEZI|nr:hypothetical protein C7212DRAFT_181623 [Tuber magnatum]